MKDIQPWSKSEKTFKIELSVVKILRKTLIALWHRRYAKIIQLFQRSIAVTALEFRAGCVMLIAGQFQNQEQKISGSISVSGKLRTYPSPNSTVTLTYKFIITCRVRGLGGAQLPRY